jgi:long-chain fatty acid transport protein
MRRNAVLSTTLALGTLAFAVRSAGAQGFGIYEHDACAMGRAGTGVASPCNASAIYFNPAAIVNPNGTRWNIAFGGTLISPRFTYRDSLTRATTDGTENNIPVPNAFITRQMGGRYPWAVGVGVFAPYGLISEWPNDFSGRFLGYRSELKTIYIQPTVAIQLRPWLLVGGGFDYIYGDVNLRQRVDLSSQSTTTPGVTFAALGIPSGTDFADVVLEGTSWSAGGHFGVLLRPIRRVSIGARYLLKSTADIAGWATFTQLPTGILLPAGSPLMPPSPIGHAGYPLDSVFVLQNTFGTTLARQRATTNVPLPNQLIVGAAVQPIDNLTLLFDVQWVQWDRFRALALTFEKLPARTLYEDYRNTTGLRFGAEWRLTDKVTLRGGALRHDGAAPTQTVTPLLPEAERAEATGGISFRIGRNGTLDLAYQRIWQADRRGRVVEPTVRGPEGAAFNTGLYAGKATLLGASFSWGF